MFNSETLSLMKQQINANQQSSFNSGLAAIDEIVDASLMRKRLELANEMEKLRISLRKCNIENNREAIIENLIKYFKLRKEEFNQDLSGCIAGYYFTINENKPTFMSITKPCSADTYGHVNDSVLTTDGNEVSYEYVEGNCEYADFYNKEKNEIAEYLEFTKYDYVIDGDEINEYIKLDMSSYCITSEQEKEIIDYFINALGYTYFKTNYLSKLNIESPTTIQNLAVGRKARNSFIQSQDYVETGIYNWGLALDESKNREELLQKANQFKKNALAVYSLVLEAYNRFKYEDHNELFDNPENKYMESQQVNNIVERMAAGEDALNQGNTEITSSENISKN